MKKASVSPENKRFFESVKRAMPAAARRARKIARMHGTPIYVLENGKIVARSLSFASTFSTVSARLVDFSAASLSRIRILVVEILSSRDPDNTGKLGETEPACVGAS